MRRVGGLLVFSLATVLANPQAEAAQPTIIRWKIESMIQGEVISLDNVVDINSRGAQVWSVSGGCTVNRKERTLSMKESRCRVVVRVAKWKQFPARSSSRMVKFSRGGWIPPEIANSALLADGSAIFSGQFSGPLRLGEMKNQWKPCGAGFTCDEGGVYVAKFGADGAWKWLSNPVGPGWSEIGDSAVLGDGSTFVVGTVYGEQTFGKHTVNAELDGQGFIAKINPLGEWDWVDVLPAGSSVERRAASLDVGSDGSLLVRGYFDRSITIGEKKLEYYPDSGNQSFVGKMTDRGAWAWVTNTWLASYESVVATTDGGAVVVGCVEPSTTSRVLGSGSILQPTKRHTLFVLKVSNLGKTAWTAQMDSEKSACVGAVAPTADGGALIAGTFESLPFMQSSNPAIRSESSCLAPFWKSPYVCFKEWEKYQSSGDPRMFVAELSKDGQWIRGVVGGTAAMHFNRIRSLQRFADGTTIVGGVQCTTTTFGETTLGEHDDEEGGKTCAGFLAKLTSSFMWDWAIAPTNDDFLGLAAGRGGSSILGAELGVPVAVVSRSVSPSASPSSRQNGLRTIISVVALQQ